MAQVTTKYIYVIDHEEAYRTFAKAHEVVQQRAVSRGMVAYDKTRHKRMTPDDLDAANVIYCYRSKRFKITTANGTEQVIKTDYYNDGSVIYSYPIIN